MWRLWCSQRRLKQNILRQLNLRRRFGVIFMAVVVVELLRFSKASRTESGRRIRGRPLRRRRRMHKQGMCRPQSSKRRIKILITLFKYIIATIYIRCNYRRHKLFHICWEYFKCTWVGFFSRSVRPGWIWICLDPGRCPYRRLHLFLEVSQRCYAPF